jgi:hypothetical protein
VIRQARNAVARNVVASGARLARPGRNAVATSGLCDMLSVVTDRPAHRVALPVSSAVGALQLERCRLARCWER